MSCIWGQHNGSQLFIDVSILPTIQSDSLREEYLSRALPLQFKALIDTGANVTAISPRVAQSVGLLPSGKMPLFGVAGSQYHNFYIFHVGFIVSLMMADGDKINAKPKLDLFNFTIRGPELALGTNDFDILLGMDVIGKGSLAVEGSGTFSFSY